MKRIVHISDLHFNKIFPETTGPLCAAIRSFSPDVIVISGDLTQRAYNREFRKAAQFISELSAPIVTVPGNHDIPLYDIFNRFRNPFGLYVRHIAEDLEMFYDDGEISIAAQNSSRPEHVKHGRLTMKQIDKAAQWFEKTRPHSFRIYVSHHPFDLPQRHTDRDLIGTDRPYAMRVFDEARVDLMLAGHLHRSYITTTRSRYPEKKHASIIANAGTATSTRMRGFPLSWNAIEIDGDYVAISQCDWNAAEKRFEIGNKHEFRHISDGWIEKEKAANDSL